MFTLSAKRYYVWFTLAGLVLFLFGSTPSNVDAATITVGCSVSELKDAIETANADAAADTLDLASNCTYTLDAVDNSSPQPNGLPVISTDITINGNNAIIARSSTGGTPAFRVMQIAAGVPVHIHHLTIQNGLADYGDSGGGILNGGMLTLESVSLLNNIVQTFEPGRGGGAIYNAGESLTLTDCTLNNNQQQGSGYRVTGGGAIWSEGTLNITNSHFDSNSSANNSLWPWNGGGAIYINAGMVTIQGTTFTQNSSAMGGGAITNVGDLQVTDSTFTSNFMVGGGFLSAGAISSLGPLTLTNTSLTSNTGGAVNSVDRLIVTGSTFSNNTGGGIVTAKVAEVTDSHLIGNTATNGAGISNDGTLTVSRSEFGLNTAENGAGIWNRGTLTVRQSEFTQNTAATFGGGIHNEVGATLDAADSLFQDNTAAWGAGVMTEGTAVIGNSIFTSNHATLHGGGLANFKGAVKVKLSTFTLNHADQRGGGIASVNDQNAHAKLTLYSSTIKNNEAQWGGGVYEVGGTLRVKNSTFANNRAPGVNGYGGGIYMTGGRVWNSTVAENVADQHGGGIWTSGKSDLLNVTLFKNQAKSGAAIYIDQQSTTLKNTIFANGKTGKNCAVHFGTVIDGGHNLNTDTSCGIGPATQIRFDKNGLQDNGGPTQTVGLRASSPAVDTGDDAVCAAAPIKARDQRGVKRPQGTHCDIGAFELKPQSGAN